MTQQKNMNSIRSLLTFFHGLFDSLSLLFISDNASFTYLTFKISVMFFCFQIQYPTFFTVIRGQGWGLAYVQGPGPWLAERKTQFPEYKLKEEEEEEELYDSDAVCELFFLCLITVLLVHVRIRWGADETFYLKQKRFNKSKHSSFLLLFESHFHRNYL